jgi:hypothetical protein
VRLKGHWHAWITAVVALAAVACGTTAAPTVQPGGTTPPTVALPGIANPTPRPTPTTVISTPEPVATAMPTRPVSAKDSITLAMEELSAQWWQWEFSIPVSESPALDETGESAWWDNGVLCGSCRAML